jgi:hypothetical protein
MLDASPDLEHALQKVATIAQMVLLVPRTAATAAAGSNAAVAGSNGDAAAGSNGDAAAAATGSNAAAAEAGSNESGLVGEAGPVLVINTHLFFHPFAPHIRTLHTAAMLEEAAATLTALYQQQQQQQQQQQPHSAAAAVAAPEGFTRVDPSLLQQLQQLPPPTVLFCGDLNSDLNDGVPGVVELLQTGQLAADHWDWKWGASFKWGKEEGEYAEDLQQLRGDGEGVEQQQQQHQQEEEEPQQQQQQQQQVLADGHDFSPPAESPTKAVQVYGQDVTVPFVLRR